MLDFYYILAQRDDNDGGWVKVLFGVIFAIIWAVSALGTWLNKKHEEARRQRLREQLNQGMPEPQAPVRPPTVPVPTHRAPPAPQNRFPKRAPQKRGRAVTTPPPVPVLEEAIPATTSPVTATEISGTKTSGATLPAASAASLARWLRPETLRHQFILTEILQPPLALREPRE